MKVGYISRRRNENGKEIFRYIEGNATRRIGTHSDNIKVKFLYGTTPYEEVKSNTELMAEGKLVVVHEPFFTNDALKERLEKWCEWANNCEHREYSFFGEADLCV